MKVYGHHFVKDDHVFFKLFYDIHYGTVHLHVGFGDHIFIKYCIALSIYTVILRHTLFYRIFYLFSEYCTRVAVHL